MRVVIDDSNTRNKQTSGVWAKFGDSEFLVAHMGNLKFQRVISRLQAPHRFKIQKGTLDPAVARTILCRAMSEAIILDWRQVINSEGQDVPFSVESCEMALTNNDELRDWVQEFSSDLQNYKSEEDQDDVKSSRTS